MLPLPFFYFSKVNNHITTVPWSEFVGVFLNSIYNFVINFQFHRKRAKNCPLLLFDIPLILSSHPSPISNKGKLNGGCSHIMQRCCKISDIMYVWCTTKCKPQTCTSSGAAGEVVISRLNQPDLVWLLTRLPQATTLENNWVVSLELSTFWGFDPKTALITSQNDWCLSRTPKFAQQPKMLICFTFRRWMYLVKRFSHTEVYFPFCIHVSQSVFEVKSDL